MSKKSKIIVFDTGSGGRFFAQKLQAALTNMAKVEPVIDSSHAPYGLRSQQEIIELTETALSPHLISLSRRPDLTILACNTATVYAIDYLRLHYPDHLFVGFEPMIKTAAQRSKTHAIAVLATPATLRSLRYQKLKSHYASNLKVYEPDCRDWARLIDLGQFNFSALQHSLSPIMRQPVDQIVLGCTHYLAIQNQIRQLLPQAAVLDPTLPIIRYAKTLLGK